MTSPKLHRLRPSLQALDQLPHDVDLVLGLCSDDLPLDRVLGLTDWRLGGELSRSLKAKTMRGAAGEQVLLSGRGCLGAGRIFVFGLGAKKNLERQLEGFADRLAKTLERAKCKRMALALPGRDAMLEPVLRDCVKKFQGQDVFIFSQNVKIEENERVESLDLKSTG